ncbi:MAG TPA: archaemetzincin family Zn-dependent metalloprotease [Anaeromyxobacteraceae bacterium]|nr:archaemetzincin family Zn-dependent metalloprotease [Anaeromyxobacteraceae bacterium]
MDGICVWWIGENEPESGMIDHVQIHVERAFDVPVRIISDPARPEGTLDARRRQHASGRVLKWLLEKGPPGAKVLGVTDVDLFIPILTFVFGEAQLGGTAAVVSTARLKEPLPVSDPRLVVERLAKEAVHELGHAMGLVHCATPDCAMGRSASVRDVDSKRGSLCGSCKAEIRARAAGGSS